MGTRAHAVRAAAAGALTALLLASAPAAARGGDRAALAAAVAKAKVTSDEIASGDGKLVVVPAWGARVMGVLFGEDNALWLSPNAGDASDWNKGGERTWLGPEGHDKGFFFDRTWKQEAWKCPPALDPGKYGAAKARAAGARAYRSELALTANDGTKYHLAITREIAPAPNPLAGDAAAAGLKYVGFRVVQRLQNLGDRALHREIGLWSLLQAKPPATMTIPIAAQAPGAKYRDDFFEPIPKGYLVDGGDVLSLKVAGPPRYKIGVPAPRCRGLTGSIGRIGGAWQLIVKRFPCDPQGTYTDRPKSEPTSNGDPIEGYSHLEPGAKAFYELECHGPAIELAPGAEQEHPVEAFFFRGPEKAVRAAAGKLFGVDGSKLKAF